MPLINFHSEEIEFKLKQIQKLRLWIQKVIAAENKICSEISYIFCDDAYLHRINLEYLQHDTYTDIITFDYSEGEKISGDLFISIERVTENAAALGHSFDLELKRVMIHGILHLCGYPDTSPSQEKIMRQKEDFYLALFEK